jgi:Zn finger protein HypA/HybF involved in hydrogenase expression
VTIGIIFVYYGVVTERKIAKNNSKTKYATYVICLQCRQPFSNHEIKNSVCPKCGGTLENLTGFYDRHPELKD